jgi:hypothetical protein
MWAFCKTAWCLYCKWEMRVLNCELMCHHMSVITCHHMSVITCHHMSVITCHHMSVITCLLSHAITCLTICVLLQYFGKAELKLRIILFRDMAPYCRGSVSRRFESTRCLRLEDLTVPEGILLADHSPQQNLCVNLKSSNLESQTNTERSVRHHCAVYPIPSSYHSAFLTSWQASNFEVR